MKYTWLQRLLGIHKLVDYQGQLRESNSQLKQTLEELANDHNFLNAKLIKNNIHRLGNGVVAEDLGFVLNKKLAEEKGITSYTHQKYGVTVIHLTNGVWKVVYEGETLGEILPKDANWFLLSVNSLLSTKLGESVDIASEDE